MQPVGPKTISTATIRELEKELRGWGVPAYRVPDWRNAWRSTRRWHDLLLREAGHMVFEFQTSNIVHAHAVYWVTLEADPVDARNLIQTGFIPDTYETFVAVLGLNPGHDTLELAVALGPDWSTDGFTHAVLAAYRNAGIADLDAIRYWEPRRRAGEDITGELALLTGLRDTPPQVGRSNRR